MNEPTKEHRIEYLNDLRRNYQEGKIKVVFENEGDKALVYDEWIPPYKPTATEELELDLTNESIRSILGKEIAEKDTIKTLESLVRVCIDPDVLYKEER